MFDPIDARRIPVRDHAPGRLGVGPGQALLNNSNDILVESGGFCSRLSTGFFDQLTVSGSGAEGASHLSHQVQSRCRARKVYIDNGSAVEKVCARNQQRGAFYFLNFDQ